MFKALGKGGCIVAMPKIIRTMFLMADSVQKHVGYVSGKSHIESTRIHASEPHFETVNVRYLWRFTGNGCPKSGVFFSKDNWNFFVFP